MKQKLLKIRNKIVSLDFAGKKAGQIRSVRRTIVFVYGTFDLYHPGHVYILEEAKSFGDMLIVAVYLSETMENRPVMPTQSRAFTVASHTDVDYVVCIDQDRLVNTINTLMPETVIVGKIGQHENLPEYNDIINYGGKMIRIPSDIPTSSKMIQEKIFSLHDNSFF